MVPNLSVVFNFFVYETDQKLGPELLNAVDNLGGRGLKLREVRVFSDLQLK